MAVSPDGSTLIVAESYANQLTAYDIGSDGGLGNRRVWAETPGDHPDGICMDAEGAVWYADVGNQHCVRVREGGEVLATASLDRGAFACALSRGGDPRLFVVGQAWGGPGHRSLPVRSLRSRRPRRAPGGPDQERPGSGRGPVSRHPGGREIDQGALRRQARRRAADLAGRQTDGGLEGRADLLEVISALGHVGPADPLAVPSGRRTDAPVTPRGGDCCRHSARCREVFESCPQPSSSTFPSSR